VKRRKHLRKFLKRNFWKAERKAEKMFVERDIDEK